MQLIKLKLQVKCGTNSVVKVAAVVSVVDDDGDTVVVEVVYVEVQVVTSECQPAVGVGVDKSHSNNRCTLANGCVHQVSLSVSVRRMCRGRWYLQLYEWYFHMKVDR